MWQKKGENPKKGGKISPNNFFSSLSLSRGKKGIVIKKGGTPPPSFSREKKGGRDREKKKETKSSVLPLFVFTGKEGKRRGNRPKKEGEDA